MELLFRLYNNDRKNNSTLLVCAAYCCFLLLVRAKITNSIYLFFLIWNLFLAAIPYALILYLKNYPVHQRNRIWTVVLLCGWLLFLPNSFYIITDLIHLEKSAEATKWFDLIIVSSFASVCFIMGILSLSEFENIAAGRLSLTKLRILIIIICFLCGMGIYLGRVQRYNSWDIIGNPIELLIDMATIVTSAKILAFAFNFGLFIYIFYQIRNYLFNTKF